MASREQRDLMRRFYSHSGWEFMGHDTIRADDPEGFRGRWRRNVSWLRDIAGECERMIDDYPSEPAQEEK